MRTGIKLKSETIGDGRVASRGDTVTVSYDLRLNRGDLVQSFDSYTFTLGSRDVITALDYGFAGMADKRVYRADPYLGCRDGGLLIGHR